MLTPKLPRPLLLAFAFLSVAAVSAARAAAPVVVIDDTFDDGNVIGNAAQPAFWNLQTIPQGDNGIFERNGYLSFFATGQPYTYACINSRLDDRLNFFRHVVTFTVDDFILDSSGVPAKEAIFRLSINPTELRQTMSPKSISLRFCPGLALLGYRLAPVGKTDAENVHGTERGASCNEPFEGALTGFSLTLDPLARPGVITFTLTLLTKGPRPVITRTGTMDLRESDWSEDGRSALIFETRRNSETTNPDSFVSASIGHVVVTSTP
jgi:hypothetical protein